MRMTSDPHAPPAGSGPLAYRPCVGLLLLNRDGEIFAGRRIDNQAEAWQMPQGGVDEGESPREAALRELGEETGLASEHVEILAESPDWIPYDLPEHLIGKLWGGRFCGQTQKWFALRLLATDSAINIATEEPEFCEWRWMDRETLLASIVPFKRDVYERVFATFDELIGVKS